MDYDPSTELLNLDEAAELMSISRATLFRYFEDGRLARIKHAGRSWVERAEITDYFARQRAEAGKRRSSRARRKNKASNAT